MMIDGATPSGAVLHPRYCRNTSGVTPSAVPHFCGVLTLTYDAISLLVWHSRGSRPFDGEPSITTKLSGAAPPVEQLSCTIGGVAPLMVPHLLCYIQHPR